MNGPRQCASNEPVAVGSGSRLTGGSGSRSRTDEPSLVDRLTSRRGVGGASTFSRTVEAVGERAEFAVVERRDEQDEARSILLTRLEHEPDRRFPFTRGRPVVHAHNVDMSVLLAGERD